MKNQSVLDGKVIDDIFMAVNYGVAKQLLVDAIKSVDNKKDNNSMKLNLARIDSSLEPDSMKLVRIQTYASNSLLKFMGMGTIKNGKC